MDLIKRDDENVDELLQAQVHVWNHVFRFVSSMSLKCAVELEIPDIIHKHGEPMTISELASALAIHPSKVHGLNRLMSILVHSEFFAIEQKNSDKETTVGYAVTPASRLLLKDNPLSARSFLLLSVDPFIMEPWNQASAWFQSDDASPSVFSVVHGDNVGFFAGQPRLRRLFREAFAADSLLVAKAVISKCKCVFEGLESLVDVGGATGLLTKVLADAFPQMDCTVLDLPHVVDGLQGSKNFKYVAGNMFEKIPQGQAIMLKWVLIDWGDEDCIKILKKCKEAIIGGNEKRGKVIIIDGITKNHEADEETMETRHLFNMQMVIEQGTYERNEQEWAKLFAAAGFTDHKIHHVLGLRSLVELFP